MWVFSDFDGTISIQDTTDAVLKTFADPAWEAIEESWISGEIGTEECMQRQIRLIRAKPQELDDFLDGLKIDPAFPAFAAACAKAGTQLTIVSDGVDYFIKRILTRHGLGHLAVVANCLYRKAGGDWALRSGSWAQDCATGSGVCKCKIVQRREDKLLVYIGDGRSDFCVSARPDIVFAKSKLAEHCKASGKPYAPYDNFATVSARVAEIRAARARRDAPQRREGIASYA